MLKRSFICLIALLLLQCCLSTCSAQITSLFWYKGMRIDKYILLTTSGKKVVFDPSSNKLHVYVPEKDDLFIKCVKNMADPEKSKKELIKKKQKASGKRAYPAFAIPISKAIEEVQGQFTKLTESTIEVPAATAPKDPPKKEEKGIPGYIQSGFNDVMSSVDKLNKTPIESPPTPPSVDFDYCYSCDPDRKAAYARDSAQFMKYLEPERSGMNKLVNVIHSIDLLKD